MEQEVEQMTNFERIKAMSVELHRGDCLDLMKDIPDGSIDMILCDIPYGEVNRKSSGLRNLDKSVADVC